MVITINKLIRTRRKTMALVVEPDGSLTVRAPLRMADLQISKFVESHQDWIVKHQAKARRNSPPPKKQYIDGESFLYLGESHPLRIKTAKKHPLLLDRSGFRLAKSSLPKAEEIFIRWYKKQARVLLNERVEKLAKTHGFTYQKIRISSARTRWGSCSSKGTLSFTWRLVMAPLEVVDYVIIHELVHTQVKNHSKSFWKRVGENLPDYKRRLRWLKQNGKYLAL